MAMAAMDGFGDFKDLMAYGMLANQGRGQGQIQQNGQRGNMNPMLAYMALDGGDMKDLLVYEMMSGGMNGRRPHSTSPVLSKFFCPVSAYV